MTVEQGFGLYGMGIAIGLGVGFWIGLLWSGRPRPPRSGV
jgi:hypothetical protein